MLSEIAIKTYLTPMFPARRSESQIKIIALMFDRQEEVCIVVNNVTVLKLFLHC